MLRVLGASLAFNSEKSMLLSRLPSIRRHPMPCPNSSGGDALEHTQYGQGFGRQQSNGMPGYGNSTISSHILSRHSNSVATSSLSGNFKISLGYISIRQTKHWSCVSTKRVRSKQVVRECKIQKIRYYIKGLMTRKFAKIPILGQPVEIIVKSKNIVPTR